MDSFGKAIWRATLSALARLIVGVAGWLSLLEGGLRPIIVCGMRRAILAVLLAVLLLGGTLQQLTQAGIGIVPTVHAQALTKANTIQNPTDPRFNATVPTHPLARPSTPPGGVIPPPSPNIARNGGEVHFPMQAGLLDLTPGKAAHFMGSDGRLEVSVPADAITAGDAAGARGGKLRLSITQVALASGSNAGGSGHISFGMYMLQVVDGDGVLAQQGLRKPVTLTLHYLAKGKLGTTLDVEDAYLIANNPLPAATVGAPLTLPQSTGRFGPFDTTSRMATPSAASSASKAKLGPHSAQHTKLDAKKGTISATLMLATSSASASFGTNAAVADFGRPDPFNVDLNAGSLSAEYPIDVPAGPGGLTPPVKLTYSSAAVSEDHSGASAAPWTGEGWNLSLGSISWSEHNVAVNCSSSCTDTWESSWQLSDPYGTGAELIPPDINVSSFYDDTPNTYCDVTGATHSCPIEWHTSDESHARVFMYINPNSLTLPDGAAHPPCWRVFLQNGIMEEFGCGSTDNALQYYYAAGIGDVVTNFLLDMIVDRYGNQIHITYQQDAPNASSGHKYVRDSVPQTIEWDSPTCQNTSQNTAQLYCNGTAAPNLWQPLMRVNFSANHTVAHTSGSTCSNSGTPRCDNPNDVTNGEAAPKVESTFVLNDIQVQVRSSGTGSWNNTLRDYKLSYDQKGHSTTVDPTNGQTQSIAGRLLLTQLQTIGSDGTTSLPPATFNYTNVREYYEDSSPVSPPPAAAAGCGPSWNGGTGPCNLWSWSFESNGYYLSSFDNGLGAHKAYTWANARNNTHGGYNGNNADPLSCNGHESGNVCNEADDQGWSHVVLTQDQGTVVQAASGGNTTITTNTYYTYRLTTFATNTQLCGNCVASMYWGNQNDLDWEDFYNPHFQGFTEADVTNPDNTLDKHFYYATDGWGVWNTSKVSCSTSPQRNNGIPCHNAPWWGSGTAEHGHEYRSEHYGFNGTPLLSKTTTQYTLTCPPSGVSPTPPSSTWGDWDSHLVSMLDHNNPMAVCDIKTSRVDNYTYDGASGTVPQKTTTYTYDSYGRETSHTDTSNDGGAIGNPTTIVYHTDYIWNNSLTPFPHSTTGTYLISFPAHSSTDDSAGNHYSCTYIGYDGQGYLTGQQSTLTTGAASSNDRYSTCGTSSNSGLVRTRSFYDSYGNQIASDDPDSSAGYGSHLGCTIGTIQYTTCTAYDTTFHTLVVSSTNAKNQTTTTGYGSFTDPLSGFGLWSTTNTDTNNQTTTFTYDALGRMTGKKLPGETAANNVGWNFTITCAATGAQTPCLEQDETTRVDASTTVTSRSFYDGWGRLVETRTPGPSGYDVVTYANYDPSGRVIQESNSYFVTAGTGFATPDANQAHTSTAYDGAGRVLNATDPNGKVTSTSYSVACNVVSGDTGCYEQTNVVDANSHQRSTFIDAFGRLIYDRRNTGNSTATYATYATTQFAYDYNGNLTKITHPNTAYTTSFTYDATSRKTSQADPDRGTESYIYDADGNLIQASDGRGASGTVYAGYDPLDRLAWRNTTNSSTGAFVSYGYDTATNGVGRKASETFQNPAAGLIGIYNYNYDTRGRQTGMTVTVNGTAYTLSKTYDDASEVLTQTYPNGEVVTTQYTGQSWFAGLTTTSGGTTTTLASNIVYSTSDPGGASGMFNQMSLGSGTYFYNAAYDNAHRLTSASLTAGTTTYFQTQPTYDNVGNVTGVTTTLQAGTDNQAFCYDEQNRLTWASSATATIPCGGSNTAGTLSGGQYTQSFTYDTLGRLASGPLGTYTYGPGMQAGTNPSPLHGVLNIGTNYGAAYDGAGDMTCRAPNSSVTCSGTQTGAQLGWDVDGHLQSWQNAPGASPLASAQYLYDGEGQRVEQKSTQVVNGPTYTTTTTTDTAYIGNIEDAVTTTTSYSNCTDTCPIGGSVSSATTYYYAGTQRIALNSGGISYLGNDRLGSADVALNSSGVLQGSILFAPYGGSRYSSGTMPGSFGFTGQRSDTALTGLDYYGARYYDPLAGQFTSADTVLPENGYNPWGLSRYAYVTGNPETHIDADGHCWPVCAMLVGALVGGAIAAASSIATQAASGKSIDWGQVGKEAAVGAVAGAVCALVGPEAGPLVRAAVDTGVAVGSQVATNALNGKPLGDGVLMAGAIGLASSVGMGAAAKVGGKVLGKVLGRAAEAAESEVAGAAEEAESSVASSVEESASCALSFAPDTQVATPTGEQAIGTLQVGDHVTAYDPATGKTSTQTVQHVWINHDTDLIDVTLRVADQQGTAASDAKARQASVMAHGLRAPPVDAAEPTAAATHDELIHTTAKHPWLTTDRGFVLAGTLQAGERVVRENGTPATVVAVAVRPGAADYYNLTVSVLHTYAVGAGQYVVHNCPNTDEGGAGSSDLKPLENADKAKDVEGRLKDYALNPEHPVGGNKARVFKSLLGYDQTNYEGLAQQIREGAKTEPAIPGNVDSYGRRFRVDIPVQGPGGSAVVRTAWFYDVGSDIPRLISAYVR